MGANRVVVVRLSLSLRNFSRAFFGGGCWGSPWRDLSSNNCSGKRARRILSLSRSLSLEERPPRTCHFAVRHCEQWGLSSISGSFFFLVVPSWGALFSGPTRRGIVAGGEISRYGKCVTRGFSSWSVSRFGFD